MTSPARESARQMTDKEKVLAVWPDAVIYGFPSHNWGVKVDTLVDRPRTEWGQSYFLSAWEPTEDSAWVSAAKHPSVISKLPKAESISSPEPNIRYKTIVADPPWLPKLGATWNSSYNDKARPHRQYPTMNLEEIKSLSVPSDIQSHLYLWAIAQHVDWAYEVSRAWGFDPVILWTWRKPGLGVGRFRCNSEHILVARKGSRHDNPFGAGGRHMQATTGTVFDWPRRRHSQKPDGFFSLVESLSKGPYLEMFARNSRTGWHSWGNEVDCDLQIIG